MAKPLVLRGYRKGKFVFVFWRHGLAEHPKKFAIRLNEVALPSPVLCLPFTTQGAAGLFMVGRTTNADAEIRQIEVHSRDGHSLATAKRRGRLPEISEQAFDPLELAARLTLWTEFFSYFSEVFADVAYAEFRELFSCIAYSACEVFEAEDRRVSLRMAPLFGGEVRPCKAEILLFDAEQGVAAPVVECERGAGALRATVDLSARPGRFNGGVIRIMPGLYVPFRVKRWHALAKRNK
jgi:hypothetical protein